MTFDRSAFSNYKEVVGQTVKMGTGAQAVVEGIGDIIINASVDYSSSSSITCSIYRLLGVSFFLLLKWTKEDSW